MTLYCFDVDGTLLTEEMGGESEYVAGVIPTKALTDIEKAGHIVVIVSPSPYLPKRYMDSSHWFKRNGSNDYRWENILDAINLHTVKKEDTIYVDDLEGNRKQVEEWGVRTFSPEDFIKTHLHVALKECKHGTPNDTECTPCLTESDLLLD